ncbi:hypothetical protein SAMN05421663_105223 [Terribacillus halophilus]|uniref:Uncharacterized protein n=1 Tax=Terribacillus halophilus TaxID=361279 RepID=A0A1G6QVX1_9BACI|nr:hypothetical protein SAMN05421663_105223 [Terribacillus halophilus]
MYKSVIKKSDDFMKKLVEALQKQGINATLCKRPLLQH